MAGFKLSPAGLEWLKKREAVIPYVYDDGRGASNGGNPERDRSKGRCLSSWSQFKGYPTIALGLRIYPKDFSRFTPYLNCNPVPPDLLQQLIREPIVEREDDLNQLVGDTPITQSMFDAMFSMMYNTGKGNPSFKKVIAAVRAKDYTGAAQAIANGPKTSKGKFLSSLAERRKLESEMFMRDGLPGGAKPQAPARAEAGETLPAKKSKPRWGLWIAIGGSVVLTLGAIAFFASRKPAPLAVPAGVRANRRRRRR